MDLSFIPYKVRVGLYNSLTLLSIVLPIVLVSWPQDRLNLVSQAVVIMTGLFAASIGVVARSNARTNSFDSPHTPDLIPVQPEPQGYPYVPATVPVVQIAQDVLETGAKAVQITVEEAQRILESYISKA